MFHRSLVGNFTVDYRAGEKRTSSLRDVKIRQKPSVEF